MNDYRLNAPEWMKKQFETLCKRGEENFNDAAILTEVGTSLFLLDYYPDEALYYLKRAVEVDSTNIDARFWLALSLYHDFCDYEQVKQLLHEAVRLAPKRADCLSLLAYAIRDMDGVTSICLQYLKSAIEASPDWTLPRQVLIQLYTREGDLELAEREIKKLSTVIENMGPDSVKTHNNIEDYYESCITGRLPYEDNVKSLQEQIEELNRAKLANLSE